MVGRFRMEQAALCVILSRQSGPKGLLQSVQLRASHFICSAKETNSLEEWKTIQGGSTLRAPNWQFWWTWLQSDRQIHECWQYETEGRLRRRFQYQGKDSGKAFWKPQSCRVEVFEPSGTIQKCWHQVENIFHSASQHFLIETFLLLLRMACTASKHDLSKIVTHPYAWMLDGQRLGWDGLTFVLSQQVWK